MTSVGVFFILAYVNKVQILFMGVFTIYVDKMRGVGGLPDVNEMSTEEGRGSIRCQR